MPVRYLGVPLIFEKLSDRDYKPLIDKITSRIQSWTSKFIFFEGRLQLIQVVLLSMSKY